MTADCTHTLSWDEANRLSQIINGVGATIDFAFGPEGKRIKKVGASGEILYPGAGAEIDVTGTPNTREADFCIEALNKAICTLEPSEIMNTDQGSQFTSFTWTDRLRRVGVRISMDGKGWFLDNIFVERHWRSLKYECVYLHA